jgi:hypothetical protein
MGTLCFTALKGCRRSAIAAGVKSESMSHSDSSCHRQSQSLVCYAATRFPPRRLPHDAHLGRGAGDRAVPQNAAAPERG